MPLASLPLAFLVAGLLVGSTHAAEFPRAGVPEVQNGVAAPFVGTWKMAWPETGDTIAAETLHDCAAPVEIAALGETRIQYLSPRGSSAFDLNSFAGRTGWLPEGAASSIAVWTGPDGFLLFPTDGMGKADWSNPYEFTRC